jgi:hypothetical protein
MSDTVWLATAKTLAAGRRIRIECCAQDKSLMVSNEERGYRAYCFRCGPRGFVAHGDFSIDQLRRRRDEFALLQEAHVRLPKDFTTEIPTNDAVWLFKAGIATGVAKHYGFGYSPSLRRVVLPVYSEGALAGFTARSTIGAKPKYIERMASSDAVFMADPATRLPDVDGWSDDSGPDLVITEDILSAVRVGRIAKRAVALLGTSANAEQLSGFSELHSIAVWLDPDRAGRVATHKIVRRLCLQGKAVQRIRTDRDPKFFSNREIRSLLSST